MRNLLLLLRLFRHQTCRPTSFNRSCTGNDELWSLLNKCAVNGNSTFGQGERKFQGTTKVPPIRESTWKYVGTKVPVTIEMNAYGLLVIEYGGERFPRKKITSSGQYYIHSKDKWFLFPHTQSPQKHFVYIVQSLCLFMSSLIITSIIMMPEMNYRFWWFRSKVLYETKHFL